MKFVVLWVRPHNIKFVGAVLVVSSVVVWQVAGLLEHGAVAQPENRIPVTLAAALLAATLLSATLPPTDWEIETSTAMPKIAIRAIHTTSYIVAADALLSLGLLSDPATAGATVLVRDVLGLCGSVLLVAAFADSKLSWTPAFAYTSIVFLAGHSTNPAATWMRQPGNDRLSWLIAASILGLGSTAFILNGPDRRPGCV